MNVINVCRCQVAIQLTPSKAILAPSYNSPLGLYSKQNITDVLVNTVKRFLSFVFCLICLKLA